MGNQFANARGFAERGCGTAVAHLSWSNEELAEDLRAVHPVDVRRGWVHAMRRTVPGDGADLIVQGIC